MTVMGGANDRPRSRPSWPADLPLDMPLETCTAILRDRLRVARIACDLPIRMTLDPVQRPDNGAALTLHLLPADGAETSKLASLRQAIAAATRLSLPEPDNYRFHVTIAYSIAWLSAEKLSLLRATCAAWAGRVAEQAPILYLGSPEFCTFPDMYAFHRLLSIVSA